MIHYSCDRCKRSIDPDLELRYIVRLEIQAAMEPLNNEESDDDRDHLLEIQEILNELESETDAAVSDSIYQRRSFDLCKECYRKFVKNPVGRDLPTSIGYSKN
jgi:hypothetical protein